MEQNLILRPLEGLEIDGKLLPFGADRETVTALLGMGAAQRSSFYFFENELRIDFDGADKVEFIECLGGIDGVLQPALFEVPVFQTDAQEVLELLMERNGADVDDSEGEYGYSFLTLSVGLYREITPSDINAMMKQLLNTDLTAMGDINISDELRRANHWDTVGIGRAHYYD